MVSEGIYQAPGQCLSARVTCTGWTFREDVGLIGSRVSEGGVPEERAEKLI